MAKANCSKWVAMLLLDNTNHERDQRREEHAGERAVRIYTGKLFTNNYGWTGIGVLLWIVFMAAAVALACSSVTAANSAALRLFGTAFAASAHLSDDGVSVRHRSPAGAAYLASARNSVRRRCSQVAVAVSCRTAGAHNIAQAVDLIHAAMLAPILVRRCSRCLLSVADARRPSPAARSWMRSRASSNISASPRRTG